MTDHIGKAKLALEYAHSFPVRDAKDMALMAIANALVTIAERESTLECIEDKSRWHQMFGTPEKAARTIMGKQLTYDLLTQCDDCPYQTDECYEPSGKCAMDEYDTLLKWLRGDAE